MQVALQDPTLLQVFNALEISADDAWASRFYSSTLLPFLVWGLLFKVLLQNLGFVYAVGFGILAAAVKRKKSSQRLMLGCLVLQV